jgi:uncharacterized protein YqiB (DUF1249 family)
MDDLIKALYQNNRKRTYNELADLFEGNYKKAMALIPNFSLVDKDTLMKSEQNPSLYLFFEERTPYTGTYRLTHKLNDKCVPDVRFKIYYDAKLIEVLSVCDEEVINQNHSFLASCSDIEIKWEINHLLENWLDYCLAKNYE